MLYSLTGVLGSTQDQSVAASGGAQSKLIQSDGLAASLDDASTSSSGESQSGNVDLGEGQQAVVIGDGAHNDDGTLLALLVDVAHDTGQGDRGAVDLGHKKASEDDLVEAGIRAACGNVSREFNTALVEMRKKNCCHIVHRVAFAD